VETFLTIKDAAQALTMEEWIDLIGASLEGPRSLGGFSLPGAPTAEFQAAYVGSSGRLAAEEAAAFHARLARLDPEAAATIRPSDRQRMVRAWEVKTATGKSLREWQRAPASDFDAPDLLTLVFLPPREVLYAACDARFTAMIERGAINEAQALLALALDPDLPAMKAVGLREIAAYLRGGIDHARMIALGRQATRRYAKRQYTWFRHRLPEAVILSEQYSERLDRDIFTKIRELRLTL